MSGVSLDDAAAFAKLFDGRKDAVGVDRGGVERREVKTRTYADHLRGLPTAAIGIFPVRDDNTVMFAAIDLDEPNFDLAWEIAKLLPSPVWIERSRSGNAHIWAFFDGALPAWAARAVLRSATVSVGRPEVEVFPKQAELKEGMVGNYINLPYYGESRPMVAQNGVEIPLDRFLALACSIRANSEVWLRRARALGASPPQQNGDSEFGQRATLHICASYMLENKDTNPLMQGHRHVVLFNLAKMILNCREYDEADATVLVEAFNDAGVAPLPRRDIEQMVTRAANGGWTSTGCDDPLMAPYVHPECKIANA